MPIKGSSQEYAETIALQALTYILNKEELLSGFMASTGFSPQDFLSLTPELYQAALEFLLNNEELLVDFCTLHQLDPSAPMKLYLTLNPKDSVYDDF
jgi:hypothetical protein